MNQSNPDRIDVDYVAQLARLGLNDEERDLFGRQLDAILGYVSKLNELDVSDIEPTAHAMPVFNIWREDQQESMDVRDAALENAPDQYQDLIQVPKIVDTNG